MDKSLETNVTDSETIEKKEKSNKFVGFLAGYSKLKEYPTNVVEDSGEVTKRLTIFEIIDTFRTKSESNKDTEVEVISPESVSEALRFIDENIGLNYDEFLNTNKEEVRTYLHLESIVLNKINNELKSGGEIDIDVIYEQSQIELLNEIHLGARNDSTVNINDNVEIIKTVPSQKAKHPKSTEVAKKTKVKLITEVIKLASTKEAPISKSTVSSKKENLQQNKNGNKEKNINVIFPVVNHERALRQLQSITRNKIEISRPRSNSSYEKPKTHFIKEVRQEDNSYKLYESNLRDPSDVELLRSANKILIDGVTLKKIYENSDLKRDDLRRILMYGYDRKKIKKALNRSLGNRQNNYNEVLNSIRNRLYNGYSKSHQNTSSKSIPAKKESIKEKPNIQSYTFNNNEKQNEKFNKINKPRPILTIAILVILTIVSLSIYILIF